MKNYNPLKAIEDMAKGKKINFFNYMALGGFKILPRNNEEEFDKDDIVFSFVMSEEQYKNFLESVIMVFEIAELQSIIGDLLNGGYIKAVKMDTLEDFEFGVTFIKRINEQIEAEVFGIEKPELGNRILK